MQAEAEGHLLVRLCRPAGLQGQAEHVVKEADAVDQELLCGALESQACLRMQMRILQLLPCALRTQRAQRDALTSGDPGGTAVPAGMYSSWRSSVARLGEL